MHATKQTGIVAMIQRYFSGLKFRWIFALVALFFGIDLVVPDMIPFADEILLGLLTVLLGSWRKKKEISRASQMDGAPVRSLSPPDSANP